MMKNDSRKYEEMSFRDLFNDLSTESPRIVLRDLILSKTGMKYSTFYSKLQNDTFTFLEKKEISSITGISEEILFPETESAEGELLQRSLREQ